MAKNKKRTETKNRKAGKRKPVAPSSPSSGEDTKGKVGRPRDPRPYRMPVRYAEEQKSSWTRRAATCALPLGDWIGRVLDGEAVSPVHVKPLDAPKAAR